MAQFYKLKIQDLYKETNDCLVIDFAVPQELQENFKFRQGQHLTLKADIRSAKMCVVRIRYVLIHYDNHMASCRKANSKEGNFQLILTSR